MSSAFIITDTFTPLTYTPISSMLFIERYISLMYAANRVGDNISPASRHFPVQSDRSPLLMFLLGILI